MTGGGPDQRRESGSGHGDNLTSVADDGRWFLDRHYDLDVAKRDQSKLMERLNELASRRQDCYDSDQDDRDAQIHAPNEQEHGDHDDDHDDHDDDDELELGEALLAVASAEEYAARIIKLQQACLTPLKEDLADWLNKILNTSNITTENFMDKLDNGVIICRLAKIISLWCEQQLAPTATNVQSPASAERPKVADADSCQSRQTSSSRLILFAHGNGPLRSVSQSTNCLTSATNRPASSLNANNGRSYSNQFLNNLAKMDQTKIWEDAKCRTFYARDNVCNFIKWSKEFGVNQSVLFESDDLVLHANPRQVVLCLLDVARIAYVRYGFTEAPGLVKFEQEIDRELAAEKAAAISADERPPQPIASDRGLREPSGREPEAGAKLSSRARGSRADATDDLIMRYCRHKEEEAARRRSEQLEAAAGEGAQPEPAAAQQVDPAGGAPSPDSPVNNVDRECEDRNQVIRSPLGAARHNLSHDGRVDSLDSGHGHTEGSAATSFGQTSPIVAPRRQSLASTIPKLSRQPASSRQPAGGQRTSASMSNSELSSSRSSLLSVQDNDGPSGSAPKRQPSSDLDGKVMRIAKSYYGKAVTKDVTRLSEGKYKIADRIVFVRLLKGHRVMVRIGGGWDTLENFLFRHKSDPSQVIDVDNLLPIETKMSFEKSPQPTPTAGSKVSKLPYFRRSSSASSTNLSTSNLSASNHSLASSIAPSNKITLGHRDLVEPPEAAASQPSVQSSSSSHQISYLLIHPGSSRKSSDLNPNSSSSSSNPKQSSPARPDQKRHTPQKNYLKRSVNQQQTSPRMPYTSKFHTNRPLGSSLTPAASAANLYPATLTTRLAPAHQAPASGPKLLGSAKVSSTSNLHNGRASHSKQEAFKKLGRSNDSLQAYYYNNNINGNGNGNKSQQRQQSKLNGSATQNGNFGSRRRTMMDLHQGNLNINGESSLSVKQKPINI